MYARILLLYAGYLKLRYIMVTHFKVHVMTKMEIGKYEYFCYRQIFYLFLISFFSYLYL